MKMRQRTLPTLQSKETALRLEVKKAKKELEELEVLAAAALADRDGAEWKVEVPDLEEKIRSLEAEIEGIMDRDPYQYKFLLEDPEAVEEKMGALREETELYRGYAARLDEKLAEVLPPGMIIVWDDGD